MASQNFLRACHLSAELVCSNEIRHLLCWLVALCCNCYVGTNAFVLHFLSTKLSMIVQEKYKWKKNSCVQQAVCDMVMILASEEQQPTSFFKFDTANSNKQFVQGLYFRSPKKFPELQDGLAHVVKHQVYELVIYLYEYMVANDIKSVYKIMHAVLAYKPIEECETLDIVRDVKRPKNDPVWVLWKVLMIYAKRPPSNQHTLCYVENAFDVFCYDYSKRVRQERINLLFASYLICVRRKPINYNDTSNDVILNARNRIHVVYEEILNKETEEKHLLKEHRSIQKKQATRISKKDSKPKSSLTPEQLRDLEDKTKFMFVITYKKPRGYDYREVQEHMVHEPDESIPHYKTLKVGVKTNLATDTSNTEASNGMRNNVFVEKM